MTLMGLSRHFRYLIQYISKYLWFIDPSKISIYVITRVMEKIASPKDLELELRKIIAYCGSGQPSRKFLASSLEALACKVSGNPPCKIDPEPTEEEIEMMAKSAKGGEATWAKLRDGSWGVRLEFSAVPGVRVTVRKKSGQTSIVELGRKIWSDGKIWLFAVESSGGQANYRKPYRRDDVYDDGEVNEMWRRHP